MSTVKVNTVDKRTGSTLTLGGCGTTVTLAAGATQSGFGRTGTVDWCTTAKTAPFTGVSGKGYFVNTTCGAVTVTLPATPSAGDIISVADYASTFQTNNLTICNNSSKINGVCAQAKLTTQGQSITLVYVDSTRGWKNTMDSTSNVTANAYITATGGTITTCGNYKIHTFTADGCFAVTAALVPANNVVSYVVVAGGGAGANHGDSSGAGAAGGYREGKVSGDPYTASPIAAATGLPVSSTTYPITVGAGGALAPSPPSVVGPSGSNSSFSTITSAGGGGGGVGNVCGVQNGAPGGSGGGSGTIGSSTGSAGTGNTPPTNPPQGNPGGTGSSDNATYRYGGGGGGAGAPGNSAPGTTNTASGGAGVSSAITGASVARAGGGGAGGHSGQDPCGAPGGSGGGGKGATPPGTAAVAGTTNTGGGGGGSGSQGVPATPGAAGGSGIVIIRYQYQ